MGAPLKFDGFDTCLSWTIFSLRRGLSVFRSWKSSTAPIAHKLSPTSSAEIWHFDFANFFFLEDFSFVSKCEWTEQRDLLVVGREGGCVCKGWGLAGFSGDWEEMCEGSSELFFFRRRGLGDHFFENLFGFLFCVVPSFLDSSTGHFHWFFYGCFFGLFLLHAWLVLFNPLIGSYQVVSFRARVDVEAMAMKRVLRIPQSSSITGTSLSDCFVSYTGHSLGGPTPLQRSSRCILQPQPTGQIQKWLPPLMQQFF